ncbi:MAG TPA: SIMPL domain-containing protein [Rhizomicrobium sp.]|nr:SIMPL domain-containing protein [Rhizomicrobium sp.]
MRAISLCIALSLASPSVAFADTISLARTITVDGRATIYVDPDHASMTLGVVTDGATVSEALRKNNVKMNGVLTAVRGLGVKQGELQTSAFSIGQTHPTDKDGRVLYDQISGYEVTNSLTVTVSDLAKVGAIIDAAADAGANTSNNVTFEISNRDVLLDKVRGDAMRNAKRKAEIMANAVGANVGALITVGNANVRSAEFENAPAPPPPPPPPPSIGASILPGQLEVTASVTAVFALK